MQYAIEEKQSTARDAEHDSSRKTTASYQAANRDERAASGKSNSRTKPGLLLRIVRKIRRVGQIPPEVELFRE